MLNSRIIKLLQKIEWKGSVDYSIGVETCPCCGKRGNVRKESQWYQGHSDTCELNNLINELTDNQQFDPDA